MDRRVKPGDDVVRATRRGLHSRLKLCWRGIGAAIGFNAASMHRMPP
jgi:hypothetical protein